MLILTVLQGPDKGRRFEPGDEPQLIGRSSEAIPTTDQTISRCHCELTPDDSRWYINDLDSANGTYVNGLRVTGRRRLEPGDQILTGNTLFLFGVEAPNNHALEPPVTKKEEMDISVERVVPSNDSSIIMAVPDPSEASAVQLKLLYELTQLIGSPVNRQQLLEQVMRLIFDHFHADRGCILLRDEHNKRLNPVLVQYRPSESEQARIPASRTIVQHVMQKGEGVLSSNAMVDSRFARGDSIRDMAIRSALCVPIKFKDRLFGVIHLDSQMVNYTFTEDHLLLLTAVGVHTGLALANAQLYAAQLERERLAAVGETVASLSHSIRNIIQGLRGGADVVELGLRKDSMKVVRGGWDIVARNLDRIYALTMNMLAYSKQRKPEVEMVNLNSLLEEIVALVQKQYDDKQVALISDLDAHMPPLPADSSGIHQAVMNLLNNGLDAVDSKTGVVSLRTHFTSDSHQAQIIVHDNGAGIAEESRKRLFEPFHSTKGQRGTGLGLVVTKKIIEEHGGSIRVTSGRDSGTTFKIILSLASSADPGLADTHGPAHREVRQ